MTAPAAGTDTPAPDGRHVEPPGHAGVAKVAAEHRKKRQKVIDDAKKLPGAVPDDAPRA